MFKPKKNLPFFVSFANGLLRLIGGSFTKEGFKLESFGTAKLPLDAIKQGEIVQQKLVAEMITDLLTKAQPKRIKTDFCHFSLADEFVFSKFLTLPKVKKNEVEPTIFFKIKDFLPHKLDEMYLDWQPLVSSTSAIEVNVVAVRRKIIDSYLKTMRMINIFPSGFEPESCSLVRLVALVSPDPSLVIYFHGNKVIFCFGEKGVVILTTTLSFSSVQGDSQYLMQELVKSAKFWEKSFAGKKIIKNVYLAGSVQDELALKRIVKDNFNSEVKRLPLPIILPSQFLKERLIDLIPLFGLAFSQNPYEWEVKKITLIPYQIKKERELFKFKSKVKNILKTTSLILFIFIAAHLFVFLSIFFQLEKTNSALGGWDKIVFTPTQLALERDARSFNQKLSLLSGVFKKRKLVSPILLDFSKQLPAGIVVTEFNFSLSEKVIEIRGTASSRDNILTLEKSLSKLGEVTIPLSSFEDVDRPQFSAVIKLK